MIAGDSNIGILLVERFPFPEKQIQILARSTYDPPRVNVLDPLCEQGHGKIEKKNGAVVFEMLHGFPAVDHASSGCDNMTFNIQGKDMGFFQFLESADSFFPDYGLKRPAFPCLDVDVRIDEGAGKGLCKKDPQGAFACAGHADQDDIASAFHFRKLWAVYWKSERNVLGFDPSERRKERIEVPLETGNLGPVFNIITHTTPKTETGEEDSQAEEQGGAHG